MMRSLLHKTLYDKRWFILGWSLGMAAMCWFTVIFFPALQEGDTLSTLTEELPESLGAFKGLIGDQDAFRTIGGYVSTQLYDIRLSIFMMVTSLMLALSLGSADEERGRLRTLLASPMSRSRIILEHWLASSLALTVIILATLFGVLVGIVGIGEDIPWKLLMQLTLMSILFTIASFTITYAVAIGTGKRALATLVGVLLATTGFVLSTFGPIVGWLKDWQPLSLLYYFSPKTILNDGINWWHVAVLISLIALFYLGAVIFFRRRDVNGG